MSNRIHQYQIMNNPLSFPTIMLCITLFLISAPPVVAGVGLFSGSIPNDDSYHSVDFNVPPGTTHTVVKVALDIKADPDNEPDFRVYEKVSNLPQPFDNPQDLKTVKFGGGPADNLADVEWYCPSSNPDPCAGNRIIVFRIDHNIRTSGSVGAAEIWTLEIKNNDTDARDFFLGVGHSSAADGATAIAESTSDAEVPKLVAIINMEISGSIDFGEILSGLTLPEDLPEPLTLTIANVGTGPLRVSEFGNPGDPVFDHNADTLPTPFPMSAFDTLDIPISFVPTASTPLGPKSTNMSIMYYPEGDPSNITSLDVALNGIAVKLELVMLYDISGSMALTPAGTTTTNPEEQRLGQAKQAGSQIKDLLQELDGQAVRAGLVTFPQAGAKCEVDGPTAFTKIPGPGSTTNVGLDQLKNVGGEFTGAFGTGANSLQTTFGIGIYTPLAEGLKVAHGTGTSNFSSTRWTENAYARRALLLLSDGAHSANCNSTPPQSTDEDWVDYLETSTIPGTRKIRIFTIPYGIPGAAHVNQDILEDLAEATEGSMYYANAMDFGELKRQFRKALIEWRSDWNSAVDPKGTITKGGRAKLHDVCIDDSVYRIAFVLDWDKMSPNTINFVLEGPDGVVSPSSPDVFYHSGQNYALYVVKGQTAKGHAGSDKWTLRLAGGSGLDNGETIQYSYSVITKSRVTLNTQLGSQPFYTLQNKLFEISLRGINKRIARDGKLVLKYDIPRESFGRYLSSMKNFDPYWLVLPTPLRDLTAGSNERPRKSSSVSGVSAQPLPHTSTRRLVAPVNILGEPATMVQRKAYALTHFAKRPFKNRRKTGEIQLNDEGKRGDRIAKDGIYSAYLPKLKYDGLARFGAFLSVDSGDCLNRELSVDKMVRVALDPDVLYKNIRFKDVELLPFYPPELTKILKRPVPEGFVRKSIVFTPRDKAGNYWGPGRANQIKFAVKGAESLGPMIDNMDGSYVQVIQFEKKGNPSAKVSARGVTTKEKPYKRGICLGLF